MATFRDDGLELNVKANISDFSTPTGDRFTIFAVNAVSPSGRYYTQETGQQLWMVDSSGGMHEISSEWLEARVEATSAKLDYIYPAITQFMSSGLLFRNSTTVQTICSDLNLIGDVSISGAISFVKGSLTTEEECPTYINGGISAYSDFKAYDHFDFNKLGTIDTLDNITPFFVRSSANRLQPEGWSDPALLVIGNTRMYDMFKPTDRGLRFTVLNRETLQVVHDEVYDTAGSQHRVTDLAWKMFELMNNTKRVGILNSREDWESLIWRKQTVESAGMSASDLSPNYANLTVGSLLDQFDRFGLLKAIRAAGKHAEMYPNVAGSQYCAIFDGSDIYVDTSGASAMVYATNRAVESWIPRVDPRLPVGGEQQRAQLVGWFMQPRQLDSTNNIADRSASFVAYPYGRENDATREVVFVNKNGSANEFNVKLDNLTYDLFTVSFASVSGAMSMTSHKIVDLGYANVDEPEDAVNVEFTRIVTPVGAIVDFAGDTPPSNWLIINGAACSISAFDKLFTETEWKYGFLANVMDMTGGIGLATSNQTGYISGVAVLPTTVDISGNLTYVYGQISNVDGVYVFATGDVVNVTGTATFVADNEVTGNVYHFRLPTGSGKVSVGAGVATIIDVSGNNVVYTYGLGEVGGANRHTLTTDEMPSHSHNFYTGAYGGSIHALANDEGGNGTQSTLVTTTLTGEGRSHNNMMPFVVFNKIIRYK
jgi:microcystin-dependent protein